MTDVQFGAITKTGYCCNKPVGCQMCPEPTCDTCHGSQPGCQYPKHPWKRKIHHHEKPLVCGPCQRGEHLCPEIWKALCDCSHQGDTP